MTPRYLRRAAATTAFAVFAQLALVYPVRASEAAKQVQHLRSFMMESGAFSAAWVDQRKAMQTLRQRVKDSRLDLDLNGEEFYRKKAKVMVDVERQRTRRGVRYLLDEGHQDRLAAELRRTGHGELVDLANNMELQAQTFSNDPVARAQVAREVADNYLSYRFKGYEQFLGTFSKADIREAMVETEEAAGEYLESGGDMRKLNKGIFGPENDDDGKSKIIRWLITAIAGVGLVIAIFFAVTTMTITPFLTFMSTVVGLVALPVSLGRFDAVAAEEARDAPRAEDRWRPRSGVTAVWGASSMVMLRGGGFSFGGLVAGVVGVVEVVAQFGEVAGDGGRVGEASPAA